MPNVRGDKRRTIVMNDYLWDGVLGRESQRRGTSKAKVIIDLVRQLPDDGVQPGLTYEWADAVTVVPADTGWQVRADDVLRGTYASKAKAELVQQQLIRARREAVESGEAPAEPA